MRYELECGHCGYQFVLDAPPPRTTTCAVCGGLLAIVVPVPLVPHPVSPKPAPARPPVVAEKPRPRALPPRVAGPWPAVCAWLATARTAADLARTLYAVFLFLDLFLFSFATAAKGAEYGAAVRLLAMLGTALLLPAILHVGSQVVIAQTPRTHGGDWARASLALLVLAAVLGAVVSRYAAGGAITLSVLLVLAAAGVWIQFLARLGRRLGDDALVSAVASYRDQFWFGLVMSVTFLIGAFALERGNAPLAWFGRAVAGVLGFVMLGRYATVLRLAAEAVVRRAPTEPG